MLIDYQSKEKRLEKVDYLWLHIRELPYFRALLRAVEARFYEDIELPSPTLDLGCGDGIFTFGAALLGAKHVIGIDLYSKALKAAQRNSVLLGTENTVDLVLGDVSSLTFREPVDTVVSNPPFGVKKRGADVAFLKTAISCARVIYSIHLAGEKNREFLERSITKFGGRTTQVETFEFPIPKIYEFHRKAKHLTRVLLMRIITV